MRDVHENVFSTSLGCAAQGGTAKESCIVKQFGKERGHSLAMQQKNANEWSEETPMLLK